MEITKISPDVIQVIRPIITDMSNITLEQRLNNNLGPHNESPIVKEIKKSCVHIVWDGKDFQLAVKKPMTESLYAKHVVVRFLRHLIRVLLIRSWMQFLWSIRYCSLAC